MLAVTVQSGKLFDIKKRKRWQRGFSLVEVVLAVGIFSFIALVLGGLLALLLKSSRSVLHSAEAIEMVSGIDTVLQNKAETDARFLDILHEELRTPSNNGIIEFFVYQELIEGNLKKLENKFVVKDVALAKKMDMPALPSNLGSILRSRVNGTLCRVILSASAVNRLSILETKVDSQVPKINTALIDGKSIEIFRFNPRFGTSRSAPYDQGYLIVSVRVYRESLTQSIGTWNPDTEFSSSKLVLSYDMALTR